MSIRPKQQAKSAVHQAQSAVHALGGLVGDVAERVEEALPKSLPNVSLPNVSLPNVSLPSLPGRAEHRRSRTKIVGFVLAGLVAVALMARTLKARAKSAAPRPEVGQMDWRPAPSPVPSAADESLRLDGSDQALASSPTA